MKRILYTPTLVVRNLTAISSGTGCKFLECIVSHTGELIAKRWCRTEPRRAEAVIVFEGKPQPKRTARGGCTFTTDCMECGKEFDTLDPGNILYCSRKCSKRAQKGGR